MITLIADDEEKHGRAVPKSEPERLPVHLRGRHRHEFVTWTVAVDVESRHRDTQITLEPALRPKHQRTHPGMQTVRSYNQIEVSRSAALKLDAETLAVVVEGLTVSSKIDSTSPPRAS
ncbi:hypothetical protein [Mycetocola miduiensis]|uniref:hypothetical protein n=1 Tax=Mycetocola miduiensis TaxID=995034 RepID=UPI000B82A59B|nr:hypothetical protein [Mycetocola miduiensis]